MRKYVLAVLLALVAGLAFQTPAMGQGPVKATDVARKLGIRL